MEILDYVPSFGTTLMVGLPLLYFFGIPLLILATFRTEAFPTIEPISPQEQLPEVVRAQFFSVHEALTRHGFDNEGTFVLPQAVTNVVGLIAIFVNRTECTAAMSALLYSKANSTMSLQEKFTEFCSRFDDDSEINTNNQKTLGAFPVPKSYTTTLHPKIKDVEALYSAHQAMKRYYGGGRRGVNRLDDKFGGDVAAYISSDMTANFQHARKCGYLRYQGGDAYEFSAAMKESPYCPPAQVSKPQYAPTIVGAYLMTWKQLQPFKAFLSWSRYRRDQRLLDEAGFELPQPVKR